MPSPSIDHYLAWPWRPKAQQLPDGGWELLVPGLDDLAVYAATEAEVWEHYPDMLASHLMAYLATGTPIPFPGAVTS